MIKRKIRSREIEPPERLFATAWIIVFTEMSIFSQEFWNLQKSKRLYYLNSLNTFVLSPVWVLIILHVITCVQRDLHLFPFFWISLLLYLPPSSSPSLSLSLSLSLSSCIRRSFALFDLGLIVEDRVKEW